MILGIDASSIRSGGSLSHLRGVLTHADLADFGFRKVVIWANPAAARYLADLASPTFEIRSFAYLNGSLLRLLYWHSTCLTREIRALRPDVLWVPAGIMGRPQRVPTVMLSQNMLPFEPREAARYGLSKLRIKLFLLTVAQRRAFRSAQGLILLIEYARNTIIRSMPELESKSVTIPHGVDEMFFRKPVESAWRPGEPIKLLYVSTIDVYKHQWHVVEAVRLLAEQGHPVELDLVGGAYPPALARLNRVLDQLPEAIRSRIHIHGAVKHTNLPKYYHDAHLFIFASTCETMPIIVLEAMASGLPIACSNRGPMPEILGEAGVYFDPERPADIARAVTQFIVSPELRAQCARAAYERARGYSWKRCAATTFVLLQKTALRYAEPAAAPHAVQHDSFQPQKPIKANPPILDERKRIILCFIRHYLPGYKWGGPVQSLSNIVDRLGDEFAFKIITLDRDYMESTPYPGIRRHAWNPVGKAEVFYCSPNRLNLLSLRRWIKDVPYDALYFNSFFDFSLTIRTMLLRRLGLIRERPVILADRGEFSSGAIAIKRYKKGPYLIVAKLLGLYRNIVWQASSAYEVEDVRTVMGALATRIEIAPNLLPMSQEGAQPAWSRKAPGQLKAVFISRLSMKKNLDYALTVLKNVRAKVSFTIYGVLEDPGYWQHCQAIIAALPPNITVDYKGPLPHEKVVESLQAHEVFLFPTRGENYGHAILEAFSAGLPVLISDQTPWRELADKGVGWDLPLDDPAGFGRRIEDIAAMDHDAYQPLRQRAWQYAQAIQRDEKTVQANRSLFHSVLTN